ncbi:MAG TPA: type II CAAX endopeptidase family protein [Candidatus Acidoferrales bacterium]|nr:type II CAAX endopeptidase family protein [Candidatus Acidoferrales bacterium]
MSELGQPAFPAEPAVVESSVAAPAPLPPPATRVLPADIDTPWGIMDLLLFFVFAIAMLFLLSAVLSGIAVAQFGVPFTEIEHYSATNAGFVVVQQVIWFGVLLLFLYAVVHRRTVQPFWRAVGWRGLHVARLRPLAAVLLFLACGVVLGIGADIATLFYNTEKHLPIQDLFASPHGLPYLMAFGILVAPFAEETVFRGYVYPVLAREFGIVAGTALTGILFGLVHVPQLRGGWGQIATLTAVGLALTAIRAAARSVTASYLAHLGYNTFLFSGVLLDPETLRHLWR